MPLHDCDRLKTEARYWQELAKISAYNADWFREAGFKKSAMNHQRYAARHAERAWVALSLLLNER